jgi:hypothetical protein
LVAAAKWPVIGELAPRRDASPWTISVHREDSLLRRFTLDELRSLGLVEQAVDIHCVTRWSKLNVRFEGVLLATVLDKVDGGGAGRFVSLVARSERLHSTSLPLAVALQLGVLLAFSGDGQPLSDEHGGPIRVVVPGRYFYKSLKWLERIDLLDADRVGFWESTAGYHNTADPWQEERYLAASVSAAAARQILQDRNVSARELRGLAAAGLDLAGLIATRALLRNADFRDCQLAGACFDEANLSNAHFPGANLRNASFRRADLEGANFSGANLRASDLRGARLFGASFCDPESGGQAIVDVQTHFDDDVLEMLTPGQQAFLRRAIERRWPVPDVENNR